MNTVCLPLQDMGYIAEPAPSTMQVCRTHAQDNVRAMVMRRAWARAGHHRHAATAIVMGLQPSSCPWFLRGNLHLWPTLALDLAVPLPLAILPWLATPTPTPTDTATATASSYNYRYRYALPLQKRMYPPNPYISHNPDLKPNQNLPSGWPKSWRATRGSS